MTIEIPLPALLFILGQGIGLVVSIISWYVAHVRLKDKVNELEKGCDMCQKRVNEKFKDLESDLNLDLDELKNEVRGLTISFNDFKLDIVKEFVTLKTMVSRQ
jgi:hypothetical protein